MAEAMEGGSEGLLKRTMHDESEKRREGTRKRRKLLMPIAKSAWPNLRAEPALHATFVEHGMTDCACCMFGSHARPCPDFLAERRGGGVSWSIFSCILEHALARRCLLQLTSHLRVLQALQREYMDKEVV